MNQHKLDSSPIMHIFLFLLIYMLTSQTLMASILPAPEKISKHVYAWIGPYGGPTKENNGFRMNMGFVVGGNAIAVIDTGYTPAMAKEMITHIRKISALPIKFAINSNSQPHRFFGNTVFKQLGSELIATAEETSRMKQRAGDFASIIERILELSKDSMPTPSVPSNTLNQIRHIDLGDEVKISIKPAGANHTPNSLIIEVAGDRVLFAGDILYAGRLLAITPDSNVRNWITVFENLKKYKSYTFIPGHGKPGKINSFQFPTYQYLSSLYDYMSKAVENDISIDDAMANFNQSVFSKLENFKDLAGRNSSWAYLQAEQQAFE